jgi:hypothetical protein
LKLLPLLLPPLYDGVEEELLLEGVERLYEELLPFVVEGVLR